jgi:hypothetical protein
MQHDTHDSDNDIAMIIWFFNSIWNFSDNVFYVTFLQFLVFILKFYPQTVQLKAVHVFFLFTLEILTILNHEDYYFLRSDAT